MLPKDADYTRGSRAIVEPLGAALEARDILNSLPTVLADAIGATDYDLSAPLVAAPPYVVVTSHGPILRATIDPGRLDTFNVGGEHSRHWYRCLENVCPAVSRE